MCAESRECAAFSKVRFGRGSGAHHSEHAVHAIVARFHYPYSVIFLITCLTKLCVVGRGVVSQPGGVWVTLDYENYIS